MKNYIDFSPENKLKIKGKPSGLNEESKKASYRGFDSIDQEMERMIALQWFSSTRSGLMQSHITLKGHL